MKRAAEKQLTKDTDEDMEDSEGQIGMKKADDAALATRKIRGLPKRLGASSPMNSPSTESNAATPSKFGGFQGFGAGASTPFQFTPPVSPSPFSNTSPSPSTTASPFGKPAVSAIASNTARAFSNIIGSSEPKPAAPLASQPTLPNVPDSDGDAAVEYYKSLRGLNTSILSAITKALERDPFEDVSFLLDRYKSFRTTVQKNYDEKSNSNSDESSSVSTAAATKGSFTMPAPPPFFEGFGGKLASSSSSPAPTGGGFTPKLDSSKPLTSSFSFPPAGSTTSGAFSFGTKPKEEVSKPAEPGTVTSLFGSPAPVPTSPFNFASPPSAPAASSIFKPPSTGTPIFSPPAPSPFGTPTLGGFGGFGGANKSPSAGSIGNPVGFGFGSPSKSDSSSGFTFAKDASSTSSKAEEETVPEGEENAASQETQPEAEGSALVFGNNPHDEEGEGEQDEETVHSIRSKAFRMKKAEEGSAGWADLGTGVLRIKKHKETGQRRLLLRNSSTGKIIINFNIYHGLKPTQNKKALMFVGHEDGVSQTYNVRTKTEEQATELKSILDREIAFVKAKQDG
ncbi:hypothetical protein GYMLUDRAFT_238477 [Collybiopsis luxurians FD-317 M1]|nr:hypothetical protein GYMLUDRAFT_238477 [Collybiopsis luxurians FD-317 M1]